MLENGGNFNKELIRIKTINDLLKSLYTNGRPIALSWYKNR